MRKADYSDCFCCSTRVVGCHATCKTYLKERARCEKEKELIKEAKKDMRDFDNYKANVIKRTTQGLLRDRK